MGSASSSWWKVSVDGSSIRQALKELNEISPELKKAMTKELKTGIMSEAEKVRGAIPQEPPLSGMKRTDYNRLEWGKIKKPNVSVTPGRSRKNANRFLAIEIKSTNEASFQMAELAGSRNNYRQGLTREYDYRGTKRRHRVNGQGRAMVVGLNQRHPMRGRGGRFAFNEFRRLRPNVILKAERIVNSYMALVNRKLNT